jgi:geranylgeranyl diphosphate synthase type 3
MSSPSASSILERDHCILEPFTYISQVPGKDVRGVLIDCFQMWLRIPEDRTRDIKSIISYLHNSSLLIDDIEDNSKMRRGVPVAHTICKCLSVCVSE